MSDALQQFGRVFEEVKGGFDANASARNGLICKQGFYLESFVLKLQKASWTNDSMEKLRNESGIFFSIWVDEQSAAQHRANYNIHALKLRHLKGYTITSRAFAEEFRHRFVLLQDDWPNVSLKYGPLTLMQGWTELDSDDATREMLLLMKQFERVSPLIDELLESRRR